MTTQSDSQHPLQSVADGFTFPTSLTFGEDGVAFIAESGLSFGGAPPGGVVWRLSPDGERTQVAKGLRAPVNGLTWHDGSLYLSEGGQPARLSRLDLDGSLHVLVEGFPGPGNYHLNMAIVGPDNRLYFSLGAMTNSGIVGLDAYDVGWLRTLPHGHDIPGLEVTLSGVNATTADPLTQQAGAEAVTGAFVPFGTSTVSAYEEAYGLCQSWWERSWCGLGCAGAWLRRGVTA